VKAYKFRRRQFSYQISIPDDWHGSHMEFIARILDVI
jgi:hypothetical protein